MKYFGKPTIFFLQLKRQNLFCYTSDLENNVCDLAKANAFEKVSIFFPFTYLSLFFIYIKTF